MFEVWKLVPFHCPRYEWDGKTYTLELYARVSDVSQARRLVMEESRRTPECDSFLDDIPHEMRDHFMYQFCFNDDQYFTYRRFFLGRPHLSSLRKQLHAVGLKFIETGNY